MYAVYGVADILFGRDDEREGEHAGGSHAVVQPEHPAVNVDVGHMKEPPQLTEYLQHGFCLMPTGLIHNKVRLICKDL